MREPKPETDADRRLLRDVADRGWHVVSVADLNDRPGWAFSVGLQRSFDHPEVIVFGLPENANRQVVDRVAHDVATGTPHPVGSTSDSLLAGLHCEFRAVAPGWCETFLGYAVWHYGRDGFRAVQLLWPDRDGRLPDHPEFDAELTRHQPLLEHPDAERARASDLLHALDAL
jgi:hypothetical protein